MTFRSSFDRALLPSPRAFYEHECGKLSRPSRGWSRTQPLSLERVLARKIAMAVEYGMELPS